MHNEIIGFGRGPNDFANFLLRAELSRKYGLFGRIPMWGGVRLHEFYPPLATLVVRLLGMKLAVVLYFLLTSTVFTAYKGPLVCILYLLSFPHLVPMLYVGRYSEFLGYTLVAAAVFAQNSVLSGVFLGLAGLSYPVPLLLGIVVLAFRLDGLIFLVAFIVCGWWYVPFVLNRRKLSFFSDMRPDKVLGLYVMQWLSMINLGLFLFAPLTAALFGLFLWLLPFSLRRSFIPVRKRQKPLKLFSLDYIRRRIARLFPVKGFFISDLLDRMPGLRQLRDGQVLIKQPSFYPDVLDMKNQIIGSLGTWIWASAAYLAGRGVIVYNGLPSTEVSVSNLQIPEGIKSYTIFDLGFNPRTVTDE